MNDIRYNNIIKFNYYIYSYYNQYYESPAITQKRRLLRNYNNNKAIKRNIRN